MSDFFQSFVDFFKSKDADSSDAIASEKLFQSLKSIEESANKLITWSLSIIGGSLLAIISNSYIHPESRVLKLGYLIFIGGWLFLAKTIYHGNTISRTNIISLLNKDNREELEERFVTCNNEFGLQLKAFNWALFFFAVWLLAYLMWWIFGEQTDKPITHDYYF